MLFRSQADGSLRYREAAHAKRLLAAFRRSAPGVRSFLFAEESLHLTQ